MLHRRMAETILNLLNGKSLHVTYCEEGTVTGAMRLAGVKKKSISDFAGYMAAHPQRHNK